MPDAFEMIIVERTYTRCSNTKQDRRSKIQQGFACSSRPIMPRVAELSAGLGVDHGVEGTALLTEGVNKLLKMLTHFTMACTIHRIRNVCTRAKPNMP